MYWLPTTNGGLYNGLYTTYGHYPLQFYTTGLSPHAHSHAIHPNALSPIDDVFFGTNILTPPSSPHAYHTHTLSTQNPAIGATIKIKPPIVVRGGFKPIIIERPPTIDIDDSIEPYYRDGRILKQYLVMEDNFEDNTINGYFGGFAPFLPASFSALPPSGDRPNHGFSTVASAVSNAAVFAQQARPTQSTPGIPTNVPQNPTTPLQLGSGSLGYLRLPNGAVYLGSGSLGYINNRQRAEQLQDVRNRQSPQPGPLTFGKSP